MQWTVPLAPLTGRDIAVDDGRENAHQAMLMAMKPPRLPSPETVERWQKAVTVPTSLTDDERLQILERWPLSEFNAKCKVICGKALPELLDKAVHSPQDLTRAETGVIIYGTEKATLENDPSLDRLRWPSDLLTLFSNAQHAAESEHDRTAIKHVREAAHRAREQKDEARERLSNDDRRNVVWCNRAKWAVKLNEERHGQPWGFALYRTSFDDELSWRVFQQRLESATDDAFEFFQVSEEICKCWSVHYIEDEEFEGASLATLAADFRQRISASAEESKKIPSYLRHDGFLFADSAAINSSLHPHPKSAVPDRPQRSWVHAVDATHSDARLASYNHGFQGSVKVSLPNVLTSFFARLAPRGSAEDRPEETRGMWQSWDCVYYKSGYDAEKVYPPMSRYSSGN